MAGCWVLGAGRADCVLGGWLGDALGARQLVQLLEHEDHQRHLLRVGLEVDEQVLAEELLAHGHVRGGGRLVEDDAEVPPEVGEALGARLEAHVVELLQEHLAALGGEDVGGGAGGGADHLRVGRGGGGWVGVSVWGEQGVSQGRLAAHGGGGGAWRVRRGRARALV